MVKAVVKSGAIVSRDPLPLDWQEGTELEVERISPPSNGDADLALDQWYAELDAGCSRMDSDDDRIMKNAVEEIRVQEKELSRKRAESQG